LKALLLQDVAGNMPEWFQSWALMNVQPVVDLMAAAVFAVTGALVASRKQMDIVGFLWLGVVTGVGGGTVRDLLIGAPVFWVRHPGPVIACLAASIAVYFTAHHLSSRYRTILWLDAVGLALVTIAGTGKALDVGTGALVAVVMGVITGTVGGIIRDVLGHEPSIILRREIYVTASLVGAIAFTMLAAAGLDRVIAATAGGLLVFVIRGLAISFGWSLPTYRARPGRSP
jgi:uncharacterized membrane protein YeiH